MYGNNNLGETVSNWSGLRMVKFQIIETYYSYIILEIKNQDCNNLKVFFLETFLLFFVIKFPVTKHFKYIV